MGVFLSAGQCGKTDGFLKCAHNYGFDNHFTFLLLNVNELLTISAADLRQEAKSPTHCLFAYVITTEEVH